MATDRLAHMFNVVAATKRGDADPLAGLNLDGLDYRKGEWVDKATGKVMGRADSEDTAPTWVSPAWRQRSSNAKPGGTNRFKKRAVRRGSGKWREADHPRNGGNGRFAPL